ncbi:hypothetical protein M2092_001655 [Fusobacterium sp. PH5-44]
MGKVKEQSINYKENTIRKNACISHNFLFVEKN